jgi:mannose-6-phosphate isomerase-like protein (cupin superfamily)
MLRHFEQDFKPAAVKFPGYVDVKIMKLRSAFQGKPPVGLNYRHSHAIYNATDKPVEWMNINVSMLKGEYDNFDLGDEREDVTLDKTPVFISMNLDRSLLRNVNSFHGGKGAAQYRTALGPAVFETPWAFVDHIVLPAGASIGAHSYRGIVQFYYVMAGDGMVSVFTRGQPETAAIRTGDAVPIQLSEVHSIENNGTQPLELMAVGVARDTHKEMEYVDATVGGARRN